LKLVAQKNGSADPTLHDPHANIVRMASHRSQSFSTEESPAQRLDARIVNPLVDSEWDEWVGSHPEASIFHSAAWARVLVETYGHQPCYLRICVPGELVALVPIMEVQSLLTRLRGVCMPFSDYCRPLLFSRLCQTAVMEKLRQVARERSWHYLELRGDSLMPPEAVAAEVYYGHSLVLRPAVELFAHFTSSVQRAIRKAEKMGLSAEIHSTPEAMSDFYRLHVRTRRRHGVPPQPKSFFASIQRNIIEPGLGFIVLVRRGCEAIATAMFFKSEATALYKFGASDERAQEFRGNNLAMWKAIEFLTQAGAKILHFGRTNLENEGLRRFKLSWGTTEEKIRYGKFSISADSWMGPQSYRVTFHNRVFRALPTSANRLAGVLIYPHLD